MSSSNLPPATEQVKSSQAQKWLQRLADSPSALVILFFLSMLESIIIPIPLELILIPFMLAERDRVWLIASVTLAGCLVGATIGYVAGLFLFDSVGQWFIDLFDYQQQYDAFAAQFGAQGFWAIVAVGVTPVPFQVAMLTAGATGYPYLLFMVASLFARGIRYYGLALLVVWLGEPALRLWQNHAKQVGVALLLVLALGVGGYVYL